MHVCVAKDERDSRAGALSRVAGVQGAGLRRALHMEQPRAGC